MEGCDEAGTCTLFHGLKTLSNKRARKKTVQGRLVMVAVWVQQGTDGEEMGGGGGESTYSTCTLKGTFAARQF